MRFKNIERRIWVLTYALIFSLSLYLPLYASDVNYLTLDAIHERSMVAVILMDSTERFVGHGTGVLLYDYKQIDTMPKGIWLLTARHVLEDGGGVGKYFVYPSSIAGDGSFERITEHRTPLVDSAGTKLFLTFGDTDLSLLHLKDTSLEDGTYRPLSRSQCAYSSEVMNGDRVLVFGLADFEQFNGLTQKQFLVTGGVVALQTDSQYMIDQLTFHGMSGGLVFKEYLGFQPEKDQLILGYRAIGIVSAGVSTTDSMYSWLTKIDLVDSIMVAISGQSWGQSDSDGGDQ